MEHDSLDSDFSPLLLSGREGVLPPRPLLISEDPLWLIPVREAVRAADGVVETASAREAVARLAGMGADYSHVLLDRNGADGLLDALADLTADVEGATLVLLGGPSSPRRCGGPDLIAAPDRGAIAATLARTGAPTTRNTPRLPPADLLEVVRQEMIDTRYQPIARIADRAVVAVEALARLDHPAHGPLTPDWFVPLFEDVGFGFLLTDLVSDRALADLAGPALRGLDLSMALNYPLEVLSHHAAADVLDRKRRALGLAADRIVIELTESRPVEDFVTLGRSLDRLRTLGYRIAIDDVGPAVRNLDRLLGLPFTSLKLDKGIVRLLGTAGPGAATAPRVIGQALERGLTIVAEGVEDQSTWDRLQALGVQQVQGYLVARPLPAAAVPVWLDAWRGG